MILAAIANNLPEASFMNYLMINISKLPIFQHIIFYLKSAAILLVILDLFLRYFKLKGTENPFVAKDFIRPIVLVSIICTYDIAMSVVDYGVSTFDIYVDDKIGQYNNFKSVLPLIDPNEVNQPTVAPAQGVTPQQTPPSVEGSMLERLSEISTYITNPSKILITAFEFIGSFFSSMIYTSALMIRVFGLFFLKVFGPLFIVISIFSKFKSAMWEWLRYYLIFTVWIIPFYLVNIFFIIVYAQSRTIASNCGFNDTMTAAGVSLIAIFVKFTVTKGSFSWLEKIIKVGGE
jgi:hypothetical protein